jgi:hypothetical protein
MHADPIDQMDRCGSWRGGSRGESRTMRHGSTIVPAGLVLAVALLGAGGGQQAPPADWAALTNGRFGMPIAPIYLLVRPDVQRDLRLNHQQVASARELAGRLIERLLNLKRNKPGPDAIMAEQRKIDELMAAWLKRELSEPQLERFSQINLQWEGASALRLEAVAQYLGLGEVQRLKVGNLLAERNKRGREGTLKPGEFDWFSQQALGVLTEPQKEQWDTLLGEPCRFTIGPPSRAPVQPTASPSLKGQPGPLAR